MVKTSQRAGWLIAALAALALSFMIRDRYIASVLNMMAISALLAASLRFVMLMGELNFALAAFVGLGAYFAGWLSTTMQIPFGLAIALAAVGATVVGTAFGAITLRAKGPYFLLIGFAFTEALRVLYTKIPAFGGTSGMLGIFPPQWADPWMTSIVVATVIALLAVLYKAERSDFGRALNAIRENEDVVRSVGVNTFLYKVAAIALTSFIAGVAGGLHAFVNNVISPGDFGYLLAAFVLAYVKMGGEDSFAGPLIGAIFVVALSNYALSLGGDEHFLYGGAIVLAVLWMPRGILGAALKLFNKTRPEGQSHGR